MNLELTKDEINLLDSVLTNELIRIEFPNGEIKHGKLDSRGYVRLERVVNGTFKVRFPNLDMEEIQ